MPIDLCAVASIVANRFDYNANLPLPWCRLAAYVSGCSAWKVQRVLTEGFSNQSGLISENSFTCANILNNKEISVFRERLYQGLV